MSRTPREIELAFNRVRYESFIKDLRRSWGIWAFLIAALIGVAYYSVTPLSPAETRYGIAAGVHQRPRENGSPPLSMAVQLDNDGIVRVTLPRGLLYRADSRVEIEVTRRTWPPRTEKYRFIRYVEQNDTLSKANP